MDFSMAFLYWENSKNGELRHVSESNWNLNGFFNGFFNLLNWHPDFEKSKQLSLLVSIRHLLTLVRTEVRRLPQPLHDGRDENGLLPHEARQGDFLATY